MSKITKDTLKNYQQKITLCLTAVSDIQQKWDEINMKAMEHATTLVNNFIRNQFIEGDHWGVFANNETIKERVRVKVEEECMDLLRKIQTYTNELSQIFMDLEKTASTFQDVKQKGFVEHGLEFVMEQPIFKTWALNHYVEQAFALVEMYRKELAVKKAILSDIAVNTSRDTLLVYLAAWQMQPYLLQKQAFKSMYTSETET